MALHWKIFKFGIGGILSYLLNILITYILTTLFGIYYLYSYIIAFSMVIIFNFIFSLKVIFSVNGDIFSRFIRYLIFLALFSLTNVFLVKILTDHLKLHYLLSITIVTSSLFTIKFFTYNRFVFNKSSKDTI